MTNITRRNFLKVSAAGTATAILAGCGQDSERWIELEPYVRAPEEQLAGVPSWYASTCRQCPAGCGIIVRIMNGRAVKLEGNPEHPVNRGKLCARGQAGLQLLYHPDRVTGAVAQAERASRKFEPVAWNEAINTVYERLKEAEDRVAIWAGSTTSGHLVDLFRRFADAVGAPPPVVYDRYSGLTGASVLAAVNGELFDQASLPLYDIRRADAIFSFGADFLGTWLSATGYGVAFGEFRNQPFGKRGFLVQFEPKMSITGAKADRWVPVKPGAEALVAQALVKIMAEEQFGSPERIAAAESLASEVDIEAAAAACDLEVEALVTLARAFAEAEHPLAIPGSTLAGAPDAIAAVMAVQALNIVAGTVGESGGVQFTPAPESDRLVAVRPSTFSDVQALIERMNAGDVEVLLLHGANPVYDLPEGSGIVEAMEKVTTIISFSPLVDETAIYADYILPDRTYLEGWGYEVVQPALGGLPVVSSQQPVVQAAQDVRATGDVLLTVARGIPAAAAALPWTDEVAFIKEMIATLPRGANGGEDDEVRWARFLQHGGWWPEVAPAGPEIRTAAVSMKAVSPPAQEADETYPYHLHLYLSVLLGDGSGASLPWLQGAPDPMTTVAWQTWVEINPMTADQLGVKNGDIVTVESAYGAIDLPVYIFPAIRPDTIAIPLGQGHTDLGRYAKARGDNAMRLVGMETDDSGEHLAWTHIKVRITKTERKQALAVLESTIDAAKEAHVPF